ncbi:hypothetical protein KGF56_000148 [Candida oxycetoniae]|uniref:RRM domain-containing protein n=1 Tax=Candida oxycetoniae TaxID=497107 RepID=A0AAI9X0H4_9ASCO|nr:uncharacterized protein KGF56_000148 [Candida oxycetoniae]KAI3407060.1 hypothetical protein KGF56_000148 [Candida oxycetoniae]
MNKIKQINQINQKELASKSISYKSSWHYDYRDTNYIYIGNIPQSITAKELIVIFSQYGVPTHLNLVGDNSGKEGEGGEGGKGGHRGFAFLKYANFKSCILAIDNFNGIKLGDRILRVDHNYYKLHANEREDDYLIDYREIECEVKREALEGDTKLLIEDQREEKEEKEDEFADPMEQFIKDSKKQSSNRKDRRHKSHRSSGTKRERTRSPLRRRDMSRSPSRSPLRTPSRSPSRDRT